MLKSLLLLVLLTVTCAGQTKRVAVILFNWQDNQTQPYTPASARSSTWTASASAAAYYTENSFGQVQITSALRADGDVFGWYTVPYNAANCLSDGAAIRQSAMSLASVDGYAATNYDITVYGMPNPVVQCGTGWFGPYIWLPTGQFSWNVVAHELGHGLGLAHANAYRCSSNGVPTAIDGTCTVVNYGNAFTIMGSGFGHFSIYEKSVNNWIQAANVQTVTTDGNYFIASLEQATTSIQAIRIARGSAYLYIDYRHIYGFDNDAKITNWRGPLVYLVPASQGGSENYLLDTTPETSSLIDAALTAGRTFTDSAYGINVTTVSADDTGTTVHVWFTTPIPPCNRRKCH